MLLAHAGLWVTAVRETGSDPSSQASPPLSTASNVRSGAEQRNSQALDRPDLRLGGSIRYTIL